MANHNLRPSMMDVHSELSSLLFAVKEELGHLGYPRLTYSEGVYLQIHIETREKYRDAVVAKLQHGILWGPFDYRFKCIGYPTMGRMEPDDATEVSAMVDLCGSKAPSGPVDYNNTPSNQRERAQQYAWGYPSRPTITPEKPHV